MLLERRGLLGILLAISLSAVSFGQFEETSRPVQPTEGVYQITKIILEENLIGAERVDTKVYISCGFTFDPLPKASNAKKEGKNGKHGKKGKSKKGKGKDKDTKPEDSPKVTPSKDCKAWMIHVNWSPRLGDKMKLADVGDCRLKGSFAGR